MWFFTLFFCFLIFDIKIYANVQTPKRKLESFVQRYLNFRLTGSSNYVVLMCKHDGWLVLLNPSGSARGLTMPVG